MTLLGWHSDLSTGQAGGAGWRTFGIFSYFLLNHLFRWKLLPLSKPIQYTRAIMAMMSNKSTVLVISSNFNLYIKQALTSL